MSSTPTKLTVEEVRRRLGPLKGRRFWRSLEDLAETPEFEELLAREFPQQLPTAESGVSRRRFLQLMGASMALAGLNACTIQPDESIVPYTRQPEQLLPGKPLYFATSLPGPHGLGSPVLVESHLGRPTKIEGNPEHPASRGATDVWTQAAVLDLYDPDRSQAPEHLGRIRSFAAFETALRRVLDVQTITQGAGLAILAPASTSPTLARQRDAFLARFPGARWTTWEPVAAFHTREGARVAFGRDGDVRYDLTKAKRLVFLESDLLTSGPDAVRHAREFADGRRVVDGVEPTRAYALESSPTATGTTVDHRWAVPPHELVQFTLALAAAVGVPGVKAPDHVPHPERVAAIAQDLGAHRASSVVCAGEAAPVEVHVLAHAINDALGNLGHTVELMPSPLIDDADPRSALTNLVVDMHAGRVDFLMILGGNPVYDAPANLGFLSALEKVPLRAHLGTHRNETSEYCQWHLPQSHPLETWSDLRTADGTVSIAQPLIHPLYDTRSAHQVVEMFQAEPVVDAQRIVRSTWPASNRSWRQWIHDGLVPDTAAAPRPARFDRAALSEVSRAAQRRSQPTPRLLLRPDPTMVDGRHANNPWLQECPKPITRLTWDNALLLPPAWAEQLGVTNEDHVEVRVDDRAVELPVWIVPGHAPDCATLHLGYGRRRGGDVAKHTGFNGYLVRTSDDLWETAGVELVPTGGRTDLACTQDHHSMEGRHLIRGATHEYYQSHPDWLHHGHHVDANASLMPGHDYSEGYKWGLTIDLTACTGCNACVVACQAENTVPVVGKQEVRRGREMHWIRIDRYFEGDLDEASAVSQPVLCMHCEQAPCEVVCPVAATVHSDEGLNDMVYNRCVGTRYCSNNCPYKVRRFNYFHYAKSNTAEPTKLQRNPDVTVRSRGVMEKCSYCVQRINHARIEAEVKDLPLGDGQVKTACQQACPSQAIAFGDLNNPEAQITQWQGSPLNYGLLDELGTRPRTTYLAKIRNPHPDLETPTEGEAHHG